MFGTNPAALLGTSWCPLATAVCNPPDTWFDCAAAAVFAAGVVAARHCRNPTSIDPLLPDCISGKSKEPRQLACNLSCAALSLQCRDAIGSPSDSPQHTTRPGGARSAHRPCTYRDCQICDRATPARSPSGEMRAESLPNGRHLDGRRSRIVRRRRCFYEAVEWLTSDERNRIDRLDSRPAGIEQAIIRIEARLEATLSYLAAKANLVRIETVRTPLGDKRRAGKESVSIRPPASVTGLISILVR